MSKKRAFVRYTKSGEIVPGSLIITTNGGYPDKSSLWKEVTVDQCCGDDKINVSFELTGTAESVEIVTNLQIVCNGVPVLFIPVIPPSGFIVSAQDMVNCFYNSSVMYFSYGGGTTVNVEVSAAFANSLCENGKIEFAYSILALPNPNN